jgi:streptogramin lyase
MNDKNQVVKRWLCSNVTKVTMVAGTGVDGSGPKKLSGPYGIFVDINFDLYVADYGNNRIQRFQSGQRNGTTVAGFKSSVTTISLNGPTGVVLDADKHLFIVDSDNNRIVGSGSEGFRCIVGCSKSPGSESNKLKEPWSLSFDSLGNIFVTDWGNSRIQKFVLLTNSCSKYKSALLHTIKRS